MPWIQSANRDDVLTESGLQGWEAVMAYTEPNHVNTHATGGGSMSFIDTGASFSAGVTAGDRAYMNGMNAIRYSGLQGFRTVLAYTPNDTTPFTDSAEIGWYGTGIGTAGAALDLTNGQYRTTANTAPATLPASGETSFLTIEIDIANNETRFEQTGAVTESVTIAEANVPAAYRMVLLESNGTGETLEIPYARQTIHGEGP